MAPRTYFLISGTLRPGMRWFEEIKSHLAGGGAFIALIGPTWMPSLTTHLQRGGEDYVAKEIDLALRSGPRVTVIPVLVGDAELPDPRELPPSLRALPGCQQERLRHTNLLDDIDHLIRRLGEVRDEPGPEPVDPGLRRRRRAGPGPSRAAS